MSLKTVIKPFVPKFVRRYIGLSLAVKTLRAFYFGRQLRAIKPLIFATGETNNFTYDLTDDNLRYLAEIIAIATHKPAQEIEGYINEAISDTALRSNFDARMSALDGAHSPSNVCSPFGRRLGWYAVTRALKPRLLIETGVDRGHGSFILCAALLRNQAEGSPGRYIGTDIDPDAGWLLSEPYSQMGQILYGDPSKASRRFPAQLICSLTIATTRQIMRHGNMRSSRRCSPSAPLFWAITPTSPTSWRVSPVPMAANS